MMMEPNEFGVVSSVSASKNGEIAATHPKTDTVAVVVQGIRLEVSPTFEAAVQRVLAESAQPLPDEMTISQAADFLGVSQEYIRKLLKREVLPSRMVENRRCIPSAALEAENEKMFHRARKAAEEMTRISQELGLYDSDMPHGQAQ